MSDQCLGSAARGEEQADAELDAAGRPVGGQAREAKSLPSHEDSQGSWVGRSPRR